METLTLLERHWYLANLLHRNLTNVCAATLKKSIYAHQSLDKYEEKETWWSPKVSELPETHEMFPGNVYRERLYLYPIQSPTGWTVCQ